LEVSVSSGLSGEKQLLSVRYDGEILLLGLPHGEEGVTAILILNNILLPPSVTHWYFVTQWHVDLGSSL
jgi:hypothetical protein